MTNSRSNINLDYHKNKKIKIGLSHQYCRRLAVIYIRGTLRSRNETSVDFDKICMFCSKCVFIIIKIKCVNFCKICDIYDKINFTTKLHTFYTTQQIFIKTHPTFYQNIHKFYNICQVQRNLRISSTIKLEFSLTNPHATFEMICTTFLL